MLKVAFIGAGSVVFTKNLVCDVLQFPELQHATIALMDIDPARLDVARVLVERIIAQLRIPARVEATLDRTEAIRGARYVICTIQVGGYRPGTVIDFEIPRKYGLLQTIGDTLGVGGVFRALRTIPRILDIARDIAAVGAPGCLFLNYTNPMAMNCMAVDHATGVPTVGLCHSVQGTSQQLAAFAGLDPSEVGYRVAGINHMAFFLEFTYRGQDAYPLLFRRLEDPARTQEKVRFEMMRRLGYFVTESSEHQSEYSPHFIHFGPDTIARFDIPIDEYLRRCESIIATWQRQERDLLGGESGTVSIGPQTHEYGSYIIHSRETGTPRVIYGNVPNLGLITNLPHRCCVEVPCLVDRQGIQPTHVGDLPPQLAAICRTNVNVQELAVAAALTGRREHIYHACMADPHTAATLPLDRIWAMCDELIEAHQREGLLGAFSPVVPGTGRAFAGTGDRVLVSLDPAGAVPIDEGPAGLELRIENPRHDPFRATIRFEVEEPADLPAPAPVDVEVAAGATAVVPLSARVPGLTRRYVLAPLTGPGVLARPLVLETRRRVDLRSPQGSAVEVAFMSVPLLRGRFTWEMGALVLRARVADTAIRIEAASPWAGSVVELFIAPAARPAEIHQFFILPRPSGAEALNRRLEPAPSLHATVTKDPGGYDLEITVDAGHPAFAGAERFGLLLDLIVGAGALGDAHSACRTGWNGREDSWRRSGHFALAVV